jgi:hypothetical protein
MSGKRAIKYFQTRMRPFQNAGVSTAVMNPTNIMKKPRYCSSRLFTVIALGGLVMVPGILGAQESPDRQPEPPARERPAAQAGAAQTEGIPKAIRQLRELQRQGKTEEAARLAQRIRGASAGNPRVMAMLDSMDKASGPKPEKPDRQARPERPGRQDQATPPSRPGNRAGAAAPNRPAPPQRPMAGRGRPAAESAALPRTKVRHLVAASRHLAAAGYEEMAAKVRAEMQKLIAETRRAHGNAAPGPPADAALRGEVERLRRENAELRNRQNRQQRTPQRDPRPADRE